MKTLKNKWSSKKEGGVPTYVGVLIVVVIVVLLGVTFKDEISTFMSNFITNATQQASTNFFDT